MPRPVSALLLVLAALTGSACRVQDGGEGGDRAAPGGSGPAAATGGDCLPHGSPIERELPAPDRDPVFIVQTEVFAAGCADKVAFEFRSGARELPPGYRAGYEEGPFGDANAFAEIDVSGEAHLVLRFTGTSAFDVTDPENAPEGELTYEGRESIVPSGMNHLREARWVSGAQGLVRWVIGLDSQRPFTVDAAARPARVIVTIG